MNHFFSIIILKDPLLGKNKFLRKAIAYSIDRKQILQKLTHNNGLIANSIYPPGILGYNATTELPFKKDLKLAKIFLEKVGYPEGKDLPPIIFDLRSASSES